MRLYWIGAHIYNPSAENTRPNISPVSIFSNLIIAIDVFTIIKIKDNLNGVLAFRLFLIRLFRVRLFRVRLFRVRLFRVRLFRIRLFRIRLFRIRIFRIRLFRIRLILFAYSVFDVCSQSNS